MLNWIKKFLAFRLGQTSARGMARMLGFGKLAAIVGIIGGIRALRRHHRHA